MQRLDLTLHDVHIVQLQAVAAVHHDVPILVRGVEVDLGVDARHLAFGAQVDVHAPAGVGTANKDARFLDEEAPVASCYLRECGDVVALVLAGLQVVCVVDGGIGRVVGGNAEGGDDSVLALHWVLVVGVGERGVAVVAGDRLGDSRARKVGWCGGGLVAIELLQ